MSGVSNQRDFAHVPCLIPRVAEAEPWQPFPLAPSADQPMAVEMMREDGLEDCKAFICSQGMEAKRRPGFGRALDDERTGLSVVGIGMEPQPSGGGLNEPEREGSKDFRGSQPDIFVSPDRDAGAEVIRATPAHLAADAV